jgi:hypothetical protein
VGRSGECARQLGCVAESLVDVAQVVEHPGPHPGQTAREPEEVLGAHEEAAVAALRPRQPEAAGERPDALERRIRVSVG